MRWDRCALLWATFAMTPLVAWADDNAKEMEKFAGKWSVVGMESGGKSLDADDAKQLALVIKGKDYEVQQGGVTIDKGTLKLDAAKKPKTIDVMPSMGPNAGKTIPAIYEFKGEELRICYDLSAKDRPTEFKTKEGTSLLLLTYKKAN